MPIYEFVCQACGNEFEQILSFSETRTPACSKCGSDQVVRQVGRPAIHFKGSGWYINDSKKSSDNKSGSGSKNSASGDSSDSSKSSTESNTTSDSKPETKVETKSETKSESSSTPAPVASE